MSADEAGDPTRSRVVLGFIVVPLDVVPLDWLDDVERDQVARVADPWRAAHQVWGYRLTRVMLAGPLGLWPPSVIRLDRACPTCGEQHARIQVLDDPTLHVSVSRAGRPPRRGDLSGVGPPVVGVAVTRLAPVGIDLVWEGEPGFAGFDDVARHPDDEDLDPAVLWARKEAVLKAIGTGLTVDPVSFAAPRPGTVSPVGPDRQPVAVVDLALDRLRDDGLLQIADRPRLVGAVSLARDDPSVPLAWPELVPVSG